MKKFLKCFGIMALILTCSLCFVACGKGDDDKSGNGRSMSITSAEESINKANAITAELSSIVSANPESAPMGRIVDLYSTDWDAESATFALAFVVGNLSSTYSLSVGMIEFLDTMPTYAAEMGITKDGNTYTIAVPGSPVTKIIVENNGITIQNYNNSGATLEDEIIIKGDSTGNLSLTFKENNQTTMFVELVYTDDCVAIQFYGVSGVLMQAKIDYANYVAPTESTEASIDITAASFILREGVTNAPATIFGATIDNTTFAVAQDGDISYTYTASAQL